MARYNCINSAFGFRYFFLVMSVLLVNVFAWPACHRAFSQENGAKIYYHGINDFVFVLHVLKATIESGGQKTADVADVNKSNVIIVVTDNAFSTKSELNRILYGYGLFDALKDNLERTTKLRESVSFPCTSFNISLSALSNRESKRIFLLIVDSKIDKSLIFECVNRTIENNYKL